MEIIIKKQKEKLGAQELINFSRLNPRQSVELAKKGVVFTNIEDWQRVATQAIITSPYSIFWRRLALQYPENLVVRDFLLLLDIMEEKPLLAPQVEALLFSLPVKKLRLVSGLRTYKTKSDAQSIIKIKLLQKMSLGEKGFYLQHLSKFVKRDDSGQIFFRLENGLTIYRFANIHYFDEWMVAQNRLLTIYGPATTVAFDGSFGAAGAQFYILPDSGDGIIKVSLLDYKKINLAEDAL